MRSADNFNSRAGRVIPAERRKNMTYTVKNIYNIAGTSNHRKVEAALRAARAREGAGWIVVDEEGNQWADNAGVPYIVE